MSPLWVPPAGPQRIVGSLQDSASDGTTITASGSTHTKGTATEIAASTSYDTYGLTVWVANVGTTATTNARALVDIMIDASLATVLVPNLLAGNVASQNSASGRAQLYHFPIYVPSGTRFGARCQASTASDTVNVALWWHQWPYNPEFWCGRRVTAYGASTATSSGVAHSPGNASFATATEITASTTNPIKALQIGIDMGTDTGATTSRGMVKIGVGATPTDLTASSIPFNESTTLENVDFTQANMILSHERFNIPSGTRLTVSAMRNVAAESRGFALYGVD